MSEPTRHPHVVNHADLNWVVQGSPDGRFQVRRIRLGDAAGGRKLGCSLIELPPGKRSWPYHCHLANEEAIFVLEGEGTLRLGGHDIAVHAGDYVALPPALETAHQMVNSGAAPLRYLCLSTMIEVDVCFYPDSNKLGALVGSQPGRRLLQEFVPRAAAVDYWHDE